MTKHLTHLQALTVIVECDYSSFFDEDKHKGYFTYNEWFEAAMFDLMSDIVKSKKYSFTYFEIMNAIKGYAIRYGAYRFSGGSEKEYEEFKQIGLDSYATISGLVRPDFYSNVSE